LTTKGGALNGIIKHNLKGQGYPCVSLNFHDIYEYSKILDKFSDHVKHSQAAANLGLPSEQSLLKRFFRFEDKLVWLTPFSYSPDKERTGGFNDEEHLLLNLNTKVHMNEYYKLARSNMGADFVVAPTEQITSNSGKKKRKRALKAAAKTSKQLAKMSRDEDVKAVLLTGVTLGDEAGLDTFDMRNFVKEVFGDEEQESKIVDEVDGFMIYGTD